MVAKPLIQTFRGINRGLNPPPSLHLDDDEPQFYRPQPVDGDNGGSALDKGMEMKSNIILA